MKKQPLLNTYVNNLYMAEAVDEICRMIDEKRKAYVVPINVDVVVKIEKDEYLKKIVDEADITLVDGQPLVWIAKWHEHPVKEKISGSDLVPELCLKAAEKSYSLFILGGAEGVADRAKCNLENRFKKINIVGVYAPPIGFENNDQEINKINDLITCANPDILIVCFGCPKQEKWIYENYQKYDARVSICAGATVDFLAENIKRAPRRMSEHGLEWLYRFIKEPDRLFKRYFIDDIKIIKLIWKYRKNE